MEHYSALQKENDEFSIRSQRMQKENDELKAQIQRMQQKNDELKEKIDKLHINICSHNYADKCTQKYYPWVDSDCVENPHYCLPCKKWICDHAIYKNSDGEDVCRICSAFNSIIFNATEEDTKRKYSW